MKKILSAVLAGLMLISSAVAVAAGSTVYTAEELYAQISSCYPYYANNSSCNNYNWYLNWINSNTCTPDYIWKPVVNPNANCTCPYCVGVHYFYVNGVRYPLVDNTVSTSEQKVIISDGTPNTQETVKTPSIPKGMIKRRGTYSSQNSSISSDSGLAIYPDGKYFVADPTIFGGICQNIIIPGKYYPYDKVDLQAFFKDRTYTMNLKTGDVQIMGTGYKMVSSNPAVVKITDGVDGQYMYAVHSGSASVYLYTAGGVPFLRLNILVSDKVVGSTNKILDVIPAEWNLDAVGKSTLLTVKADQEYPAGQIMLSVVYGDGYIEDSKLYALGTGPIVVRAQHTADSSIQGYAVIFVGKYVNALFDGYWYTTGGGICGNYWNPNLWGCDGFKINGWILYDGYYIPVIIRETTTEPDGTTTTTTIYTNLVDMLNSCHGNLGSLYKMLYQKYSGTTHTAEWNQLHAAALKQIIDNITAKYYNQMH